MVRVYGPQKTSKCSNYGITKIFGNDIINKFNWDGSKNKESLKKLTKLNNALFGKCIQINTQFTK